MSGGSMGYLYNKEVSDLFSPDYLAHMETAESMLLGMGYKDIAKDVRRLIEYINSAENRIGVLHEQLRGVFHAVEWRISADYGDDSLVRELEKYRRGDADG